MFFIATNVDKGKHAKYVSAIILTEYEWAYALGTTILEAITCLAPTEATLGEGPLWLPDENAVVWVDILSKKVFRLDLDGNAHQTWHFETEVTSIAQRAAGGLICTTRHGFAELDLTTGKLTPLVSVLPYLPGNRFNDGKIDASGNYWAGTMDNAEVAPTGRLYKLNKNKEIECVDSNYIITNGPTFSVDRGSLFHTDTLKKEIYVFDLDDNGKAENKRLFLSFVNKPGHPDGMTIDDENCLWVCFFGGARIERYSPDGELLQTIDMPVTNITSCTFGGKDLDTLYVTTARKGLSKQALSDQPLAGALFSFKPGVKGLKPAQFNG